jgi:hypothetical protein
VELDILQSRWNTAERAPQLYSYANFNPLIIFPELIATLLNDGISPTTGAQILKPSTVDEMFTKQIPQFPHFGRQGSPAAKKDLINPSSDLYPEAGNPAQGWGLTFMLTSLERSNSTGRGRIGRD